MPETPTYDNIAKHVWPLLKKLTTHRSESATTFLGPAGTAIIARHFPAGWLDKIKIGTCVGGVPAPVMSDLWSAMGYSDETSFKTACGTTHKYLFGVLSGFTNGAGFNGITYDTTIYLKDSEKNDFSLVVHELVHSLQWSHYAAEGFLSRYIEGFAIALDNGKSYQHNPAEVRAYAEQGSFKTHATIGLAKEKLGPLSGLRVQAIRMAANEKGEGGIDDVVPKAIKALMNITALVITEQSAHSGMRK